MNSISPATRFLPDYVGIEQALIGVCLMEPNAIAVASSHLQPEHFGEVIHQQVWEVAQTFVRCGRAANPVTIASVMGKDLVVAEGMKLSAYLARCVADTHCPQTYVTDFCRQIRQGWALRELMAATDDARAQALLPGSDSKALILDLMQRLDETRAQIDERHVGFRSANAVTIAVVDRMAQHYAGTASSNAISTGLRDLDAILNGGLQPGDLYIMAGRPGMGKTTLAVSVSRQSAKAGNAGGFYSLEMAKEQIGARFVSDTIYGKAKRPIVAGAILHGKVDATEADYVIDGAREFEQLPLSIDDSSSLSVGEISARTRTLADQYARNGKRLQHVWVDYLKFVRASDRYRGQRVYEVGEISAGLKSLAKDLGVAVVLLAQLSRAVESRDDKRPQLSDLRESGDLEADADAVIFLYREEYYLAQREPRPGTPDYEQWQIDMSNAVNKLELIVAKQRMGATGTIEAHCHAGASAVRDRFNEDWAPRRVA